MNLLTRGAAPLLFTPLSLINVALLHAGLKARPITITGVLRADEHHITQPRSGLALSTHWCMIPHPDKAHKGGEDACYATIDSVGVADGVGGWGSHVIDAGLYSKALMQATMDASSQSSSKPAIEVVPPSGSRIPCPEELLWRAYQNVQRKRIVGSTTATIVCLNHHHPVLHTLNLGDSGFMQLRQDSNGDYRVLEQSEEQQHYFNCPYQLGTGCDDTPDSARLEDVSIQPGDLILLATDGVFDNIFTDRIVDIVNSCEEVQNIAGEIASASHVAGLQHTGLTPFAMKAHSMGYSFDGGKLDDITVLIAEVVESKPLSKNNLQTD